MKSKSKKKWSPKEFERFWFVESGMFTTFEVGFHFFSEQDGFDLNKYIFRTKREAQRARKRIIEVLKGEV